jgi:CRP-like cAMP-binding protein
METMQKSSIEDGVNYLHFYTGLNRDAIPQKERMDLEYHSKFIKIRKKTLLYSEGESPKGLYILVKGKVKFSHLNSNGAEQIYFVYSVGDMFGYRQILSNGNHAYSAITLEHSEFLFIEKENFLFTVKHSALLYNLFFKSICKEVTVLTNMINIFAKRNVKERTAYFLLILNEKYKIPGQLADESEIRMSRRDLARYIGASFENLVRTIREFNDKRYVRLVGRNIYITNFQKLHSLTGFGL